MIEEPVSHTPIECVYCGFEAEDYTAIMKGTTPQPGDVYICWECGGMAQYELGPLGQLVAKVPSKEVVDKMRDNIKFQDLFAAIRKNVKDRKR